MATEQATRARGADADTHHATAGHHDVVALPARRHEVLHRGVEAEESTAEARVQEAGGRHGALAPRRGGRRAWQNCKEGTAVDNGEDGACGKEKRKRGGEKWSSVVISLSRG